MADACTKIKRCPSLVVILDLALPQVDFLQWVARPSEGTKRNEDAQGAFKWDHSSNHTSDAPRNLSDL